MNVWSATVPPGPHLPTGKSLTLRTKICIHKHTAGTREEEIRSREQTLPMSRKIVLSKSSCLEAALVHVLEKLSPNKLAVTFVFRLLSVTLEFVSLKFRTGI